MIKIGKTTWLGIRLYRNTGDRRRAVALLKKRGYNYFVGYRDSNLTHPAGLSYGTVDSPREKDIRQRHIVH